MYTFEKFQAYLIISTRVIVHIDDAIVRYLMAKKDAKPRLIRWVLLLEEFNFDMRHRKCYENHMVDHLSMLELPISQVKKDEISNNFPDEVVMKLDMESMTWYVDLVNYFDSGIIPDFGNPYQRRKFLHYVRK